MEKILFSIFINFGSVDFEVGKGMAVVVVRISGKNTENGTAELMGPCVKGANADAGGLGFGSGLL